MPAITAPQPDGRPGALLSALARRLGLHRAHAGPITRIGEQDLAAWLLGLRWLAVFLLFAVVVLTTVSGRVEPESVRTLWALWGLLAVINGVLTLMGAARVGSQRALTWQIVIDVVVLGALLHTAGGVENPFAGLFVFHAVVASIVLERRRAWHTLIGMVVFIVLLTVMEASGIAPPGCLRDATAVCRPLGDRLTVASAGLGVVVLVVGCALIVLALVSHLQTDRDELINLSGALAAEAERLGAARLDLLSEQEKLRSIVDCMNDAVIFAAPDGRVLLHNRAAAQLLAHQPGANTDLHVCHDPQTWDKLMAKLIDPGASETHPVLEIGSRFYEATYGRVSLRGGEMLGAVMLARDVTERTYEQATRVQKERMAALGKLAATLAHEINNPLAAIALFTQHASKGLDPDSRLAQHLGTVLRNADVCKKIVHDLLEYARQRPPEMRMFALADLIGDVTRTLGPFCERHAVALRIDLDAPTGARCYGDPDQLRQVLINLGINAVEAMSDGGQLTARVSTPDAVVRVAVEDTGPGVPPADRERVFAAFYTTKPEGTGLGLAVARDIVAAHGGSLSLDDSYGGGCRFLLEIPRIEPTGSTEEHALAS